MRILYITQTLPYPLYNGGHIRTYSTLKKLKKKKHDIYLCTFVTDKKLLTLKKEINKLGIITPIILVNTYITGDETKIKKILLFIKSLIACKPFTAYKFYNKGFKKRIEELLAIHNFDCVWIDHVNMAQYLPKGFKGKTILETHNVDSLFFKRMFLYSNNPFLKIFALSEWFKYLIYQKQYLLKFSTIYAISDFDRNQFKKMTGKKDIRVSSQILFTKKVNKQHPKYPIILFIGSLRWYPNKDGILWFIKNIFPNVQNKIPNVKLWIVGDYPASIRNLNIQGVIFWGIQNNIDKFYKNAKLFIVPIRYGSGIRIKILESMSWRLPIISTFLGAE